MDFYLNFPFRFISGRLYARKSAKPQTLPFLTQRKQIAFQKIFIFSLFSTEEIQLSAWCLSARCLEERPCFKPCCCVIPSTFLSCFSMAQEETMSTWRLSLSDNNRILMASNGRANANLTARVTFVSLRTPLPTPEISIGLTFSTTDTHLEKQEPIK